MHRHPQYAFDGDKLRRKDVKTYGEIRNPVKLIKASPNCGSEMLWFVSVVFCSSFESEFEHFLTNAVGPSRPDRVQRF